MRTHRFRWHTLVLVSLCLAILFAVTDHPRALSPGIVISQVYGGGGNDGGIYTYDFVELFNRGTTPVSLSGWSIQYTSATGTGNLGSSASQLTPLPDVTLQPGQGPPDPGGAGGSMPPGDSADAGSDRIDADQHERNRGEVRWGLPDSRPWLQRRIYPVFIRSIGEDRGSRRLGQCELFRRVPPPPPPTPPRSSARATAARRPTTTRRISPPAGRRRAILRRLRRVCSTGVRTQPSGIGSATPSSASPGDVVTLSVVVTPGTNPTSTGITVTADLTAIGGSNAQAFTAAAGTLTLQPHRHHWHGGVAGGVYSLPVKIADAQSGKGRRHDRPQCHRHRPHPRYPGRGRCVPAGRSAR